MRKKLFVIGVIVLLVSCNNKDNRTQVIDHLKLSTKLSGHWKAKAFGGELHETWTLGKDGWMQQEGFYIEAQDTSYAAITRIEQVKNDIVLFSVIKNSNPKIFKAIKVADHEIVFENKEYTNPNRVSYEFISEHQYKRTISGKENDSVVVYEFDFKKVN